MKKFYPNKIKPLERKLSYWEKRELKYDRAIDVLLKTLMIWGLIPTLLGFIIELTPYASPTRKIEDYFPGFKLGRYFASPKPTRLSGGSTEKEAEKLIQHNSMAK